MIPHVIASGELAVLILSKLLGPELKGSIKVKNGGGWAGAIGEADSRLSNNLDVALVLGPYEKPGPNKREIDKIRIYSLLRDASQDSLVRVILLKTPVEGLLFRVPGILFQLVGREPTAEQLARARIKPQEVLAELLGVKPDALVEVLRPRLEAVDLTPLTTVPGIRRLRRFMRVCARRYEARLARRALEDSNETV
ncbi:hypothetical protein ACLESD_38580 [Pyxidicoccus sp. 3LFB2]